MSATMTPDKRGIVISPPFKAIPTGGIQVGGYLTTHEIRKYLFYWDEIDYPDNNFVSVDAGPEIQFLIEAGVARRTRIKFQGSVSSGSGEFFLQAQQAAFDKHDQMEPGCWSFAQPVTEPHFAYATMQPVIEYELWNSLPVPSNDVPLDEILEFKARRRDELLLLRVHLDDMYEEIIAAADVPRAKNKQLMKIQSAIVDIDKALADSGVKKVITSLRGYIAGEFGNIAGTGMAAAGLAPALIGMDPLTAGLVGSGFAFAIKPLMAPRKHTNPHPLVYISSIRKSFA